MSAGALGDAAIDVIVRTGGRPAALLERAVCSLAAQTAGAIRLLLVRHGPADADALQRLVGGALRRIEVIDAPGANRGRALAAGLARVAAPRFALLDDDDYLLEDHILRLLEAAEAVPAPAFAYGDILVEDETAPGAGLRLFREGPAEPPLGRITDRISVHAFLADAAALRGLAFDRWTLSTAEDALLVASLLAHSTPVHSPYATCVYVQGRGDASAYLSHPDRAADELAFAREIAPYRAAIEAKFGPPQAIGEEAYLAPFVTAARHAALFAELRTRRPGAGLVALRGEALATPVGEDPALAARPAPLAFEAVAGTVWAAPGGVEIEAPQDYAYAARLPLDLVAPARPAVIAVRVEGAAGAFGLGLADANNALVVEVRVDPVPIPLEVQLATGAEAPVLIVRRLAGAGGGPARIGIAGVSVAYACAALAPGGDRPAAAAALADLAGRPRTVLSPQLAEPPAGRAEAILAASVEIALGDQAWAYVHSMVLPPQAGSAPLRVELGAAASPVFVLRVDEAWAAVGERLEAPAGARPNTLVLEPLAQGPAARLVVQAGAAPTGGRVTLQGLFLYRGGEPPGDPA